MKGPLNNLVQSSRGEIKSFCKFSMEPILARQDLRWPFWHLGYLEINPLVSVSYEMHLRVKEKRGRQERKKEVGNGLKKIFFLNFVLVYLRIPWTGRRLNQSNIKKISPEYSLEGLLLKLKLQYFGHLMRRADSLGKDPDAGKD